MHRVPHRRPERPPEWDPSSGRYWDERDLESELLRAFQICADCRMCVTYCGSFPVLFAAIDRDVDAGRAEGVETVGPETIDAVVDHCWQCKLCYIKCPYTDDEGSYEQLDFPRLMARTVAVRARRNGIPLVDRVLGEPALLGRLSAPAAPIANFVNANRLARKVTELAAGISAEFPLPPFAAETFPTWFRAHEALPGAGREGDVVLFSTCYGDYNFPRVPRAAVRVLEKNGYAVQRPDELDCCGMPNLDGGDVAAAKRKMSANVAALLPWVRAGSKVVVPGPTCGYTLKKELPVYVGTDEAREVAAAVVDLMEFLDGLRRQKKLDGAFERGFGRVAYHAACHLRAQKIAFPGERLLERLPDTEVTVVERCSAVDGTWGMKAKYYDEGRRYAERMAEDIRDAEPDLVVTDCSLAAQRIWAENGVRAVHPIEALAEAYGLEVDS